MAVQGTEYPPPAELKKELVAVVREVIGPIATPDVIHWAPGVHLCSQQNSSKSASQHVISSHIPKVQLSPLQNSRRDLHVTIWDLNGVLQGVELCLICGVLCRPAKDSLWQDHAADPAQDRQQVSLHARP